MGLHEPESAGLLERMDWLEVRGMVEDYDPDELDDVLFEALDEYTYSDFLSVGLNWKLAKTYAQKAIDYLLLRQRMLVKIKGVELEVPKPSKALKLLSADAMALDIRGGGETTLLALAAYDGEKIESGVSVVEFGILTEGDAVEKLIGFVSKSIDEGLTVLVYGRDEVERNLRRGASALAALLRGLEGEGRLIDVSRELSGVFELSVVPLSEVERISPDLGGRSLWLT